MNSEYEILKGQRFLNYLNTEKYEKLYKFLIENPILFELRIFGDTIYSHGVKRGIQALQVIHMSYKYITENDIYRYIITPYELYGINDFKPIHYCIIENKPQELIYLLTTVGVNINSVDKDMNTALHLAVYNRNLYIVKILVNSGCILDSLNKVNKTPLYIASEYSLLEIAKLLLKRGARTSYRFGNFYSDIAEHVEEIGTPGIKLVFSDFFKKIERKKTSKLKKYKMSNEQIELIGNLNHLCDNLNIRDNRNMLRIIAQSSGVKYEENLNEEELCKFLSNKIILKSRYPELFNKIN